jgi:hypothetical protein
VFNSDVLRFDLTWHNGPLDSPDLLTLTQEPQLLRLVPFIVVALLPRAVECAPVAYVFGDTVTIRLGAPHQPAWRRWTLDGKAPQADSLAYCHPLTIAESANVTSAVFGADGKQKGDVSTVRCVRSPQPVRQDLTHGPGPGQIFLHVTRAGEYQLWGKDVVVAGVDVAPGASVHFESGIYPVSAASLKATQIAAPGLSRRDLPPDTLLHSPGSVSLAGAEAATDISVWKGNTAANALNPADDVFFWSSRPPKVDETLTVTLPEAVLIGFLEVVSGKADGADTLRAGALEVSADGKTFKAVASFSGGTATYAAQEHVAVKAFRVRVTKGQSEWLVIRRMTVSNVRFTVPTTPAINVDFSEAPDVAAWAMEAKHVAEDWHGKVDDILAHPGYRPTRQVFLRFDGDMGGVAHAGRQGITVAANWIRNKRADYGMIVHELTHIIQRYPGTGPGWLTEGVADYVRYFNYEPERRPRPNPKRAKPENGYGTVAAFLHWLETSGHAGIVIKLNQRLRDHRITDDDWKDLTGKPLDALWADFLDSLRQK